MNRSRFRQGAASAEEALPFVAAIEPARLRLPGVWTTPPIIPETEATGPYRPGAWRTPPFNPDAGQSSPPFAVRGPLSGGVLDPIESPDPPLLGGLLDPVGREQFGGEQPRPRIKRKDLSPELQGVPMGPEGGLIGIMLAEYVEPDADPAPGRDPLAGNGAPPIPPRKPAPPLPYPEIPLPASADWADKGFGGPRGDVSIPTINLEARRDGGRTFSPIGRHGSTLRTIRKPSERRRFTQTTRSDA